ncbi:DMT family transporter [Rhizobium sp. C4]|uniref:DMT family transporter n=1 Tax=Rhizobium sp. C4 TaxID=1349800 RepID=UPI001E560D5A|nr:DMT family transporter [Rhizobium sp. C4]MCD2175456.1 DMT family transporter [Rhizobium sp. C4]
MSSQIKGIMLMASASAIIPIADGIAKVLSENHSALLVSSGRYFAASFLLLPLAFMKHGRNALPPRHRLKPHIVRTLLMVTAMTLFYVSIVTIDLATAVSAFFIGPVVGSVAAVFLLGEKLTKTKVAALALGFAGAIIIARPGASISPGVLLALTSGVCYGFYLVSTRLASGETTPLQALVFQNVFGTLLLLPQAVLTWTTPSGFEILLLLGMGLISLLCHTLTINAFRHADATTLAPLSYVELVTAATVGYVWFKQAPEPNVWIGAAFVATAGLVLIFARKAAPLAES